MNHNVSAFYEKAKEWSEVKLVSFTVDPDNDSTKVLADYANRFKADKNIWHFCRTNKENLFKIGQGFYYLYQLKIKQLTIANK